MVFMKENRYYAMTIDEVFKKFQVDENGLSSREALKRINKYGKNELPKKERDSIFKIFFMEILDPIVLLLIVAIIASLVVGEVVDALAIVFIVLVDLIIGTYEENKANTTVEALANLVPEKVKVDRDGKELMNKIDEIAKEENCERIELECWAFNENALGMYEHLGFGEQRVKLDKKVR